MQCMGIKTNGVRCARLEVLIDVEGAPHLHYCNIHRRVYNDRIAAMRQPGREDVHHMAGRCLHFNGTWCLNMADPDALECGDHLLRRRALERNRAVRQGAIDRHNEEQRRVEAAIELYTERNTPWHEVIVDVWRRNEFEDNVRWWIASGYWNRRNAGMLPRENFTAYWVWVLDGQRGAPPDPNRPAVARHVPPLRIPMAREGLAAIANDRQNVHTRYVSQQTNAGLEKLLAKERSVNKAIRAPDWLAARWLVKNYGNWVTVARVVNDMQHWYATVMCRETNDRLYRRQLDGLYHTIREVQDEETRNELYKRAFEECLESVGMCCDGHITRLCNVLVGFDETFTPPVPFGEILQNKMSAIYGMEIDTEEKVKLATEFFNEFAVPVEERGPWLEAF